MTGAQAMTGGPSWWDRWRLRASFPNRKVLIVPPGPQGGVGDQAVTHMLAACAHAVGASDVGVVTYAADEDWGLAGREVPVELVVVPTWPFDGARWDVPPVRAALARYDHFVIAGNDCMDGGYSDVSTCALLAMATFADAHGCRASFVNCSFNRRPTATVVDALRALPSRVPIWWRDALSAASFAAATGGRALVGAEIAFLVEPQPIAECPPLAWTLAQRRAGTPVVALVPNPMVGTRDPLGAPQRDPAPYVTMLESLCALGGGTRVVVLPNDARAVVGDLELTHAIAAALPAALRDDVFVSPGPVPAPHLAELFRHVDVVVGARFHALVMALVAGTPIVALEYQDKMRGVLRACGLEDFWIPCEGGLDPARIVGRVRDAVDRSAEVRATIAVVVPEQRRRARAMLASVLAGG